MSDRGPRNGHAGETAKGRQEAAFFAVVRGRVQGVAFRWSAREEAKRLGLTGWVRNADDGSVEVLAEGAADRLESFASWLRRGPPAARVERVERRERSPTGSFRTFTVEP